MDYREVLKFFFFFFFDRRYPRRRQKQYKFPNLNLVRYPGIMYAYSAIHLGPMPRFVSKFIRIRVDGALAASEDLPNLCLQKRALYSKL